ncbi:MAG: XrtA system polysaccharide deacetylase [Candidatus Acidiferrales bacterium]
MKCVFSVDVEDWFHILDLPATPDVTEWDGLPSRVERNFQRLLEAFEQKGVRVTCFFLGWVAEKFPSLVKKAVRQGHEIASHGYAHRLTYQMTPEAFYEDAVRSKSILEDVAGRAVWGYRSAGFSVTRDTDWFFDKLIEAGYLYDSSVFPATRGHGGMANGQRSPFWIERPSGQLFEFPLSVAGVMGKSMCFFGGGYLRLFPYPVICRMARSVLSEGRPVIFYVHPREIDPDHPRLPMNWRRRFKSYVNLESTMPKIERLLNEFQMTSFEQLIHEEQIGTSTRAEVIDGLQKMVPLRNAQSLVECTAESLGKI